MAADLTTSKGRCPFDPARSASALLAIAHCRPARAYSAQLLFRRLARLPRARGFSGFKPPLLKKQKKGLMQKLLTGEVRVKIAHQLEKKGPKP